MNRNAIATLATVIALATSAAWAQNFGSPQERYLKVEWEVGRTRTGSPVVAGYIHNDRGIWAANVRLLVEELDSAGRPVTKTLGYASSDVPPNGRAYFEVPVQRGGATYRVTVDSFDWLLGGPSG
ncbi:MAG: hypothetical protein HY726_02885 [Candidatus Rokubacteria bacterium]|nr:hypothetical protein [Candidatus Rokubacteria bacterium]